MKHSTKYKHITAIILASGKGIRYGMPKADAELEGTSFAQMISTNLRKAGIQHIHVAKGYPTTDMLGTLKQAVRELIDSGATKETTGLLCFPVDFPYVKTATIQLLIEAHDCHPQAIIRPSFYGFTGHPIIVPVGIDLEADDKGKGLRGIILHSGLPKYDIHVDDEGIHRNINYPEDLHQWTHKN